MLEETADLKDAIATVAAVWGVSDRELRKARPDVSCREARLAAIHIACQETGLSVTDIGQQMGPVDHSSILYARKAAEDKLGEDPFFLVKIREALATLRKNIIQKTPERIVARIAKEWGTTTHDIKAATNGSLADAKDIAAYLGSIISGDPDSVAKVLGWDRPQISRSFARLKARMEREPLLRLAVAQLRDTVPRRYRRDGSDFQPPERS